MDIEGSPRSPGGLSHRKKGNNSDWVRSHGNVVVLQISAPMDDDQKQIPLPQVPNPHTLGIAELSEHNRVRKYKLKCYGSKIIFLIHKFVD